MADEALVRSVLQITKSTLRYQSLPSEFRADVTGVKGPTPGAIAVPTEGVDVDLSELSTPGFCRIMNLDTDDDNFVEYGIWDGVSFYPLGEVLPGESYVLRLSRNIGQEYGTGTGTTGLGINSLRLKSYLQECNVVVEAFEK